MNQKRNTLWKVSHMLLLAISMIIGILPVNISAENVWSLPNLQTSGDQGVYRFGLFSDSHVTTDTAKFASALQAYKDMNIDDIVMTGDIVYMNKDVPSSAIYQEGNANNNLNSADYLFSSYYTTLKNKMSTVWPADSNDTASGKFSHWNYIYATGNHEFPQNSSDTRTPLLDTEAINLYEQQMGQPQREHVISGGYHFIKAGGTGYQSYMTTEDQQWIMQEIDNAIAADANKPVFLVLHHPIQETVYGSDAAANARYSAELKTFLESRPQVVNFTAHEHTAAQDPKSIWQGNTGFTAVHSPMTGGGYLSSHGGIESKITTTSQSLMIEVVNNVVYVYKMDLITGKYIGEPWIIDIPGLVAGTASRLYTNARYSNTATPVFPAGASATVNSVDNTSAFITFTQAANAVTGSNQDGFVQKYLVKAINTQTAATVKEVYFQSDFYAAATPAEMAATITKQVTGLSKNTAYTFEIYAVSPFNVLSASPLTVNTQTTNVIQIQAEDYSDAIAGIAVYTVDIGKVVSFQKNQWLSYQIDIPQDGKYQISVVGASVNTVSMSAFADGISVGTAEIPSTGSYDIYAEKPISSFSAAVGTHTIKLMTTEGISFDYFKLTRIGEMEAVPIMLEVESAEKYSTNPYDTTQTALRLYSNSQASGGYAAGWNANQWMSYSINLPSSGKYKFTVRGWANATGKMRVIINNNVQAEGDLPNTGSWNPTNIVNAELVSADIDSGNQQIKFLMTTGAWTVDYILVEKIGDYTSWTSKTIQAEAFNIADGQGAGYFDNTPDGTDFEWYDQDYSPVEVGGGNNGKVVGMAAGEWIKHNITATAAGMYELKICHSGPLDTTMEASANDASFTSAFIEKSGADWTAPYSEMVLGNIYLSTGKNVLEFKNTTASVNFDYYILTYLPNEPVSGINIKCEAESFAENNGATLNEFTGGVKVMGFNAGNTMTYNVNVPIDGTYSFNVYGATAPADTVGSNISITVDGNPVDTVNTSTTNDWQIYTLSKIAEISIASGMHTIVMQNISGAISVDYFTLERLDGGSLIQTIQAVDYNPGGQNVGYYDNTQGVDPTGYYIDRGDDVEVGTANGKQVVGMNTGEWLRYDLAASQTGYYKLTFVSATPLTNAMVEISSSDELVSRKILRPIGWNTMYDNGIIIKLNEGLNTLQVKMTSGSANFEKFTLEFLQDVNDITDSIVCGAVNTATDAAKMNAALTSYSDTLYIDTDIDTQGIFYPYSVFENLIGSGFTTLTGIQNAYADSILLEITNPSVALYNGDTLVTALESGNLTLKVNTSKLTDQIVVAAAIYNGNKLCKIKYSNSTSTVTEINFGETVIDNASQYTFKLFYWEDLTNIKPYNPYAGKIQIYVSPNGDDNNTGALSAPVLTISKAQEIAKSLVSSANEDIIVNIAAGEYPISQPLVFDETDSAADGYYVIYRGSGGTAKTVLSGGLKVENWTEYNDNLWQATLSDVSDLRHLYINGVRAQRAQSSVTYTGTGVYDYPYNSFENDGITITSANLPAGIENEKNMELVWDILWTRQRTPVKGIQDLGNGSSAIVLQDGTKPYYQYLVTKSYENTRPAYNKAFKIENAFALTDSPGEFYFDKTSKVLYYYPRADEDLNNSECYIGQSEGMLMINGSNDSSRVKNLKFENINFKYGDWLEVNSRGAVFTQADKIIDSMNESAGSGGRMMFAQIQLNWADNIIFKNNTIENIGSAGLSMQNGVKNCVIDGNTFNDTAAGAVIVGDWNHLFTEYDSLMCHDTTVKNNLIRNVAFEYSSAPAVSVYYTKRADISHNDIADTAYSGISMGWGWNNADNYSGDNKIEFNKIENVMTVLKDGANIYTLGASQGTVINGNYLIKSSDIGGGSRGGIYLDEGSAHLNITNNVVEQCSYWLFARPNAGISQVYVADNYADTANISQDTANVTVINTTVCSDRSWPESARAIIDNAGIK